jgi:superfamily II DNA/RNA helicase
MKISVQQLCEKLGIKELTPMQSEVLKASENEGDIQLISPTGSGKTLGFLFAMLKNWDENATHTQSLIITPTRELAVQIDQVFRSLGLPFKALCIFGGHSLRTELQSMDPCPTTLIERVSIFQS